MPGLKSALVLGAGVASALVFFRPELALGVVIGLGIVGLTRLLHLRLLRSAWAEGRPQAFVVAGLGKFGFLAAFALLSVALGVNPLGLALGLLLFPLGLWLELGFHVLRDR